MSSAGDWKALTEAAKDGHLSTVRMYANSGVDLNYQHPEYMTTPLIEAARGGFVDIVTLLLEHGADPAIKSQFDGKTALEEAEEQGHTKVIQILGGK